MDIAAVLLLAFAAVIIAVIMVTVLASIRQRRRRATHPARHEGERRSQRGRIFKHAPGHSNTPDSW